MPAAGQDVHPGADARLSPAPCVWRARVYRSYRSRPSGSPLPTWPEPPGNIDRRVRGSARLHLAGRRPSIDLCPVNPSQWLERHIRNRCGVDRPDQLGALEDLRDDGMARRVDACLFAGKRQSKDRQAAVDIPELREEAIDAMAGLGEVAS